MGRRDGDEVPKESYPQSTDLLKGEINERPAHRLDHPGVQLKNSGLKST